MPDTVTAPSGDGLNVVVVNDHGHVSGGAAQVAIAGLNELAARGWNVTFFSAVAPVDPSLDSSVVRVVNLSAPELLHNPSKIDAAVSGIWNRRAAARFAEVLEGLNPARTIVHLHNWTKALSASVVREATERGFQVVCTLHDYFTVCPNGGLFNYPKQAICHLRPLSLACISTHCDARSYGQKLWRVARQLAQRWPGGLPDRVQHFIAVSRFSADVLRPLLPSGPVLHRVCNPVDMPRQPPVEVAKNLAFTFVGRLSPEKGADLLAEAVQAVRGNALFVGDGIELERLRQLCPNGTFLGWQSKAQVQQALRRSRVLVFPSRWYETQGLVVQEAAACGIATIVSDSCAARDGVVHGVTGLHFKAGDAVDLAAKMDLLMKDDDLVAKLGAAAYDAYWLEPPELSRHVDELTACYEAILAERGSRRVGPAAVVALP